MNFDRAIIGGVLGGLIMSAVMAIGRAFGVSLQWELILGSMVAPTPGVNPWQVGFLLDLAFSCVLALIYAVVFENLTRRASVGLGVMLGMAHAMASGLLMGYITLLQPYPRSIPAPGFFMLGGGPWAAVFFIVAHLGFGAVVGAVYRVHEDSRPSPRARLA